MNRHTSNPFLAGWDVDESDEPSRIIQTINNNNEMSLNNVSGPTTTTRRHSSSHGDDSTISANQVNSSGGEHRPGADRRLYHRNMSSFDAASSLQMEHQQQMRLQENGGGAIDQNDLIAKMTADFQTAIETNDKQFGIAQAQDDTAAAIAALGNPFDPFETIVDDDISLPSPAISAAGGGGGGGGEVNTTQNQRADDNFFKPGESSCNRVEPDRPFSMQLEGGQKAAEAKNLHDSIDDDEDELVSTPVRNIKSSPPPPMQLSQQNNNNNNNKSEHSPDGTGSTGAGRENTDDNDNLFAGSNFNLKNQNESNTDSIAKASLFASLLASAEQADADQQKIAIDDSSNEIDLAKVTKTSKTNKVDDDSNIELISSNQKSAVSPIRNIETATHVIKGGSHLAGDGQSDRPIGFFDPFETVIDKDALTSLMNENQSAAAGKSSVEPRTEDTSDTIEADESRKPQGLPRPTTAKADVCNQQVAGQTIKASGKKTTSSKQSAKNKRKSSFQEDSSDSSDSDDRIQIVIKARSVSQNKDSQPGAVPTLVPLLPPPPSKSSMKQARERGQVEDMPSPVMNYKTRQERRIAGGAESSDDSAAGGEDVANERKQVAKSGRIKRDSSDEESNNRGADAFDKREKVGKNGGELGEDRAGARKGGGDDDDDDDDDDEDAQDGGGQFVIPMTHSDEDDYGKPDTPLYDEDTSYVLDEYPAKYEGPGWEMMLRYPPKKKLTSNRFWKKIFVKLAQVPLASSTDSKSTKTSNTPDQKQPQTCIALQIFDKLEDKKPMQEIPIQPTYTVSEISSQQFDQFGKIFTLKLQYIFYKERVGVRQGQLARFIHTGHIGSSTTSGGHGVDPISIGAIKRIGAPIEHSPQISQIIKLGCANYSDIKVFKNCLEDYLFKMPIFRDRALSTYKTEEVQMAVRDETHLELNQVGTIVKQLARVRLFFLSFLNGTPIVEVGINDIHRQGREVVGRMDILPVVTEEWIRLEACELHSTIDKEEFENPDSRLIKLTPPDATFFELLRFRIRPPRNRELPLQITANMSVTRTKVSINCDVMVPGCVSRKHGQIPCENIAIKVDIPECWIYFFREEKHFRMGSKKSVNRRPGKVKGIERFLGGGGLQDINDESSLIEVTSGQAKYEHHHHAIVWRAARWPKESQSAYVQNTMKIRLPLTAYDKMPENFYEYVHVEYTMPATTVSHTTLRSISVNPCDDEPPEKYVKYSAKYDYKVKMRLSVNVGGSGPSETQAEPSPIVIMKQPDLNDDLQREEDSDDSPSDDDDADDKPAARDDLRPI